MKNVFNLGKFKFNGAFQLRQLETELGVGQPLKQIGEDTLGIADVRQCILTTDGFQSSPPVVRDFGRGREHGGNLPLRRCFPGYRQHAENVLHLPLTYRRTSTLAWFYLISFSRKKPALFRCGLFCFLYASARIVTCGNDDGCSNGGDADAFHGCCVLCHYYLSVLYSLRVKGSSP